MTSDDNRGEFRRGPQLKVTMELTVQQHAALQEWSASIPTLYFLDICVVNLTKPSRGPADRSSRKAAIVQRLRNLDRPQHSFSYLLALMEKVSDTQGSLADADLETQILGDVSALRVFFKHARVVEPDEFLINYAREVRRAPPELSRPNYLRFLEAANGRFALKDPVAKRLRLARAEELLKAADTMSVPRQHPVVLLTLACLYGNRSARKMMKFKADAGEFNAENALADIAVIGRFAPRKLEIEQGGRSGTAPYLRCDFITDDDGLAGILPCFEAQVVRHEDDDGVNRTRIDMTVHLERLLTELEVSGQATTHDLDESEHHRMDEYQQLCAWLSQ